MVPKASQRANGQQLAVHLLNAHDNERVEVADIRGAVARDLPGAVDEWHAIAKATRCKKFLYSLSLNPDPRHGPLTRRQYKDYIARVEKKLGLRGHPRAIVFHVKEGREHCHVVWSRIIPGQLKALQISHDRLALQAITREFARDHGLVLPANMQPANDTKDRPLPARITLYEKHQQERTGISKEERSEQLTQIWRQTGTGHEFVQAIAQAGYQLARGDSVPYAVIDRYGEIHSLPRQIEGAKTKDIRARLVDFPPEALPPATSVRDIVRQKLSEAITPQFNQKSDIPWIQLKDVQSKRRAVFHARLAALKETQKAERKALVQDQRDDLLNRREARLRANARGLLAILCLIPGIPTFMARRSRKHDLASIKLFRLERRTMLVRQKLQFEDLKRQFRAISRVEKRETRSLKTSLRRDFLRARIEAEFSAAAVRPAPANSDIPTLPASGIVTTFLANGRDMTTPRLPTERTTTDQLAKKPDQNSLSAAFSSPVQAAVPTISAAFHRAASRPRKGTGGPAQHFNPQ